MSDRPDGGATATALRHIQQIHIRTTPERLWEAITESSFTRDYFYGTLGGEQLGEGGPARVPEPGRQPGRRRGGDRSGSAAPPGAHLLGALG